MIKIYAFNIKIPLGGKKIEEFLQRLNNYGSNIKRDFKFKDDLYRTIFGEIIVRLIMCKQLNLSNDQLKFNRNEFGKPYLCNSSKFNFNISHSGDWVVLAFSNYDVGIDIEKVSLLHLDIAHRFFTEDERDYVHNDNEENINYRFFKIWTLKESYIKAVGKGLSIPLDSFNVCEKKYSNTYFYDIASINGKDKKTYYSKTYDFRKEYIISISSISSNFPNEIRELSINDINIGKLNKL